MDSTPAFLDYTGLNGNLPLLYRPFLKWSGVAEMGFVYMKEEGYTRRSLLKWYTKIPLIHTAIEKKLPRKEKWNW